MTNELRQAEVLRAYSSKVLVRLCYGLEEGRNLGPKDFLSHFDYLIEELENGESILTKDGARFIYDYFGLEEFFKKENPNYSRHIFASGIKWLLRLISDGQSINTTKAKEFDLNEILKKEIEARYENTILANRLVGPNQALAHSYKTEELLNVVKFMFLLDELDSAEAELTDDGVKFIGESYGWDVTSKLIQYMSNNGFFFKYTEKPDVKVWLENHGHFGYDRLAELIKLFESHCEISPAQ